MHTLKMSIQTGKATEVGGYTVETASTAGFASKVASEESRVHLAKKQTHKLVFQVCRKQGVHGKRTKATEAERTIHSRPTAKFTVCKAQCDLQRLNKPKSPPRGTKESP